MMYPRCLGGLELQLCRNTCLGLCNIYHSPIIRNADVNSLHHCCIIGAGELTLTSHYFSYHTLDKCELPMVSELDSL